MTIRHKTSLVAALILAVLSCWVVVSGRQRQVVQVVTSPRIAVALWNTCPEGRGDGRRYEQPFWRSHAVYHLSCEYAPCGIDTPFAVAVSRTGGVTVLSGNEGPTEVQGTFYEYAEGPLEAFNSISRQEGVRINEANVEEYLRFFADAYISWGNVFVPDKDTLKEILETEWGRADELLTLELSGEPPVFNISHASDGTFQAEGYTWWFWIGDVYHLDLSVGRDGAVSFSTVPYGRQPGVGNDVALRTQH